MVTAAFPTNAQTNIWGTPTPTYNGNDGQSITVGNKFRSSQTAIIQGLRFYKWGTDSNTYQLRLYKVRDTSLIASTTYKNQTATGWVQSLFSSAVTIQPDTLYLISLFSSGGNYSANDNYFTTNTYTNGRFTMPKSSVADGYNGNYRYGNGYPTGTYEDANYWLDIVAVDPNVSDINWTKTGNNIYNSNAGIVTIGTSTNPAPGDAALKLAVNGNIYTKKLKITQTGWADFVFDSTYNLRSLEQVEQFIRQHHRLPDMPSTQQVTSQGADVGDQQVLLLQKIEELTLYIIQLKKELNEIKTQVKRPKIYKHKAP